MRKFKSFLFTQDASRERVETAASRYGITTHDYIVDNRIIKPLTNQAAIVLGGIFSGDITI